MYLDVEFTDGTVTHIPVSASHTVRVISPDDHVQDAFSFGGVKSVTLNPDGAPAATDPNPQPVAGAAEGATVDVPSEGVSQPLDPVTAGAIAASSDAAVAATATDGVSESVTPDPQQADSPNASSEPATIDAPSQTDGSDASSTVSEQPQTSSPTPTTDDQVAHDQAAAAAADAVVAAAATPADDRAAIVAKAQADIEEALAQWPDSQPLLDAKADLEQLAAGQ